jgi:hypothetical protein
MKNKLRILRGMLNRKAKTSDKHLSKLKCVSSKFGFDRGQPIDRLYIEHFINSNCGKISHACGIEVGEIHYLNSINVNNKIILSHPSFTGATHSDTQILLDLNTISVKSTSSPLADIIICTNVLNFVKYPDIAMENFRNLLTQKGKLILTVSASMPISRFDSERWGDYWRFTEQGLKLLVEKSGFECSTEVYGNYHASLAFLSGYAVEDCSEFDLLFKDLRFPITIGAICSIK